MAGDWIPMRTDLGDDPAVIGIAVATNLDEPGVVGRLHRIWAWASWHTVDGDAKGVTLGWINRHVGCEGFAEAMQKVGWLIVSKTGVRFPKYEVWNSQSAKKRALTSKRVALHRSQNCNADSVTETLPEREKSRKEKKDNPPPPPPEPSAPVVPSQPVPRTPEKREGEGGIAKDRPEQTPERLSEAETAVRTAGVNRFREAVQIALGNGMTVDGILAVVDTFHASPGKWGPPALHERLTKPGAADFAPHEGWVDPLPEWQAKQSRAAQGPKTPTPAEQAAVAADKAELDRLEAAHGSRLDAMTPQERLDLIPADQAMVRRLLSRDRGPPRGLARQTLLRLIEQKGTG